MIEAVLAKSQIGVEEYLGLVFEDRPEPDYVDGEVVERALPTPIHAQIQILLGILFAPMLSRFRLILMSELRVQIQASRFRVVDFAVYRDARPEGRYATNPALVVVEIVSPDDRHSELAQRLEDYREWGVEHIWVVDPQIRRLYEYSNTGLIQLPTLRLREFDFEISAQELFKDI
jgi:Uma2 family endonuclease